MKKIMALLIAILYMLGNFTVIGSGYLAEVTNLTLSVDYDNGALIVEGTSVGNPLYDTLSLKITDTDEKVLYLFDTIEYDNNGDFHFELPLAEPPVNSMVFKVTVGGDFVKTEDTADYRNDLYKQSILSQLKDKTTSADFGTLLLSKAGVLALDVTELTNTAVKDYVIENLYNAKTALTYEKYGDMFEKQVLCAIFACEASEYLNTNTLSKYEDLIGIELSEEGFFGKLSNEDKTAVFAKGKNSGSFEILKKDITETVAVLSYKTLERSSCEKYIEEFKNLISENLYEKYNKLSADDKNQTAVKFCGKTMADAEEIENMLVEAIDALSVSQPSYSRPKGGGVSGGVSGGGAAVSANLNRIEIDTKNENVSVYKDVSNVVWAQKAINHLTSKNILSGDGNGNFLPNRNLTREEALKIISLAIEVYNEGENECHFDDVPQNSWAVPYIASALKEGMVKGVSDTVFGYGVSVTREDMYVFIYRFAQKAGYDLAQKNNAVNFKDNSDISNYAIEAVFALQKAGAVSGFEDNSFRPKEFCTRAMAAVMIYNLMK